jgi:hypothetical protein
MDSWRAVFEFKLIFTSFRSGKARELREERGENLVKVPCVSAAFERHTRLPLWGTQDEIRPEYKVSG